MKMRKSYYSVITSVLGVVIGVLATTVAYNRFAPKQTVVKYDGDYSNWRKLNLILEQVGRHYVDTIDMKAMTDAAVVAALAGNFDGIGITFNVPSDTAIVLSVIPGGPSEKVGLAPGDRILKVDDRVIAGNKTHQDSMVRMIKGPSGSTVKILINRDGENITFDITRGKIPVNSVDASFMIDDNTAYIKLTKFSRTTYKEFIKSAKDLLSQGMAHMILDLRGNTGGYFDQALLISNEFLSAGDGIVYMEGLNRERDDYDADGRGSLQNEPQSRA